MVDQADIPEDVKAEIDRLQNLVSEYAELPVVTIADIPCVKPSEVPKDWETTLNDTLFRIMGFSVFFGALAYQCQFNWTLAIPTAAAQTRNGKFYIYINPVFFREFLQDGGYQAFVIVHEVYHIFFDHTERCKEVNYDPQIWNLACDYFLHNDIDEILNSSDGNQRKRTSIKMIPEEVFPICFDKEKFGGMTEDEIYKIIQEDQEQDEEDQEEGDEGSGDDSEGEGSEGDGEGDGESNSSESGSGEGSGSSSGQGKGKGKGYNGQYSFDSSPSNGDDGRSETSNYTKDAIARAVSNAAATAMNSGGDDIGSAEANVIRRFQDLHKPKVDWKAELADKFEKVRTQDLTYSNYNRRSTDEVVFPDKTGEYVRVYFGIDTSGSMSDAELSEAVSELQGILDEIDSWEVTIGSCDVHGYEIARLYSEMEDDLNNTQVDLRGGGGTELSPMVEAAQEEHENGDEYHVIIILTDGYVPVEPIVSRYDNEIPLLFVITGDGNDQSLGEHFDVINLVTK